MSIEDVLARLEGVRRSGNGWVALCPSHEDREPSLSIAEGDGGKLLLKCFAGCTWDQLRDKLGLNADGDSKLESPFSPRGNGAGSGIEVARYRYLDESGRELLYSKIRFMPKRFIREPKGAPSSLYHLELLPYAAGAIVYLSESEKDADAVLSLSKFEAVALSSGGASTWREEWSDRIAKARPRLVAILEHHDDAGRKFSARVAASLSRRGLPVKVLSFEGAPGRDAADAIRDGLDLEGLERMVEMAKEWAPAPASPVEGDDLLALSYDVFSTDEDEESPWLWRGLLPRVGAGILALDSGHGKTWQLLEMALAGTTGRDLFDKFRFNGEPGNVLLLLEEDARANVRSRIRQLARGRYTEDEIALARKRIHAVSHSGIQLDTAEGQARLRSAVERLRPVLVAGDPMAEMHSRPENSAEEMLSWLKPCRAMARELRFLFLFSHHTRKGYAGQDADLKQAARGTSALKGWADSFVVAKALGNGMYSVEVKQRFGTEDEPAIEAFTLQRIHEDRRVCWRVSQGIEAQVLASADAVKLLGILDKRPEILRRDLETAAGMSGKRFSEALRVLEVAEFATMDEVRVPDRAGRIVKQKLIRSRRGDAGTRGDRPGDEPRPDKGGDAGTTLVGSPPVPPSEGIIADGDAGTKPRKPYSPPTLTRRDGCPPREAA